MFKKIDLFYLDMIKKRYDKSLNKKYCLPLELDSLIHKFILVDQNFIIIQEINNNIAYFTLIVKEFDDFSKALHFIINSLNKIKYPFVIINLSDLLLEDYQNLSENYLNYFKIISKNKQSKLILKKDKQLKQLYKLCFNDSSNYIDYYFDEKIKNLNKKTYEIDELIVSALYLKDQTINYHQQKINSKIIIGASTHPFFTKQGLMSSLLKDTLNDLHEHDIPLVTLNPFDTKFYQKYDFVSYSFYEITQSKKSSKLSFRNAKASDINTLVKIYEQYCTQYDIYTVRDKTYFESLFQETLADDDKIIIISKSNIDIGYYIKIDNIIEEYCHLENDLSTKQKEYIQMPANHQNPTLNMARIINPITFLSVYPYTKKRFTAQFRIIDNIILKNNMTICLDIGHETVISPSDEYDFTITIQELSSLLLVGNIYNNPHPFYQLFKTSKNLTWEKY